MNVTDIGIVNALPVDPLGNIPASLAFLLTRLLAHEEGLLHAERQGDSAADVTWYVRRRVEGKEAEHAAVAVLPGGTLSSIISRIALMADVDHQRGGAGSLALSQNGRRFECRVFLSRCRESGYWIRLYARAV